MIFKKLDSYQQAKEHLESIGELVKYHGRMGMYSEYYLWDFKYNKDGRMYYLKISDDGNIEKSR